MPGAGGGPRVDAPTARSPLAIPAVFRCGELPTGIVPGIPTGVAALDAALPGGGWPPAALTEVLCDACGIGEVSLLLPALRYLGESGDWRGRGLLWIDPPGLPYAPALAAAGLDLAVLAVLRPTREEDALWAAEQALRTGGAAAATASSPAALRIALQATTDGALSVHLARRRGLARPVTLQVASRALPQPWLAGHGLPGRAALRRGPATGHGPAVPDTRGAQRERVPAR